MARANNNGWDFVEVGKSYQYKEDWLIAEVTILEDNSTDDEYIFKIRFDKANMELSKNGEDVVIDITNIKNATGYYSGMVQFYDTQEYVLDYTWERKKM